MMRQKVDINCDLGELPTLPEQSLIAIMQCISSCNISCGFHAGDPALISKTIAIAIRYSVAIGAHPSFPDRAGFGRNPMQMSREDLLASLLYQVSAVKGIAEAYGAKLHHVKAHGALYHQLNSDKVSAQAIVEGIMRKDKNLQLYGMPGSVLEEAAEKAGLIFKREAFIDRRYEDALTLRSRESPDAVITDKNAILRQVENLIEGKVITSGDKAIPINFDTLCVHGDTPGALPLIQSVYQLLKEHEVEITAT